MLKEGKVEVEKDKDGLSEETTVWNQQRPTCFVDLVWRSMLNFLFLASVLTGTAAAVAASCSFSSVSLLRQMFYFQFFVFEKRKLFQEVTANYISFFVIQHGQKHPD